MLRGGDQSPFAAGSRTPKRSAAERTPHRTPHRTPSRTPTTPSRFHKRPVPKYYTQSHAPDFEALSRDPKYSKPQRASQSSNDNSFVAYNPEKEPIKAYLRLRPPPEYLEKETENPYLQVVDDIEVSITPPEDSNAYRTRNRQPERYKFTKIFDDKVAQKEFFISTTLPLIKDLLRGENALAFAYGVTNSGKTYSVTGTEDNTGILPRTLDVIFNSVQGFLSDSKLKPVMHSLVQAYEDPKEENRHVLQEAASYHHPRPYSESVPDSLFQMPKHRDDTVIDIDEKFEYGIWVSFAEIYTEKIYDLLTPPDKHLKRKPLSLKYEFRSGHKYIAGIKEVKVENIEEAYTLLYEGQRNRAVYSTLLNHTSSRSHSIFTIRIVRVPIDDEDYVIEDPSYATVSKMSIVDLAGSERHRNTLNSGQRLKEAGNINKSLMVLGQCMETLRLNQLKAENGKRQAIVPFRHSKLTELFKSSFEGDGKAVMVVNVNPYDTGFDENSHVMKFAAVAKDVATWRRIHPKLDLHDISKSAKRLRTKSSDQVRAEKQRLLQDRGDGDVHMWYENDQSRSTDEDEDDDEEEEDPFVDNLIWQMEDLRDKWIEAETRCATLESTVRQQVAVENEAELRRLEEMYMAALKRQSEFSQSKIQEHVDATCAQGQAENELLTELKEKQQQIAAELEQWRAIMNDRENTKAALFNKITALDSDKRRVEEQNRHLILEVQQRDKRIQELSERSAVQPMDEDTGSQLAAAAAAGTAAAPRLSLEAGSVTSKRSYMEIDKDEEENEDTPPAEAQTQPENKFEQFLKLRKLLRRSIFKAEQYSPDTDGIMKQVEEFDGVTFELVKETNMGRLLKLIAQKNFKEDPHCIQERAKKLFKGYARLSIPVLAPPPVRQCGNHRDPLKTVHVSVDVGKEEELISEMRLALDALQRENSKLKSQVKLMQGDKRRLKKAFEKTRHLDDGLPTTADYAGPATATQEQTTEATSGAATDPGGDPELASVKVRSVDDEAPAESAEGELSPVLEAPILPLSSSSEDEDESCDDGSRGDMALFRHQERRPKRRRKLRARQHHGNEALP